METMRTLEKMIGGRWHGVSILSSNAKYKEGFLSPHVDRFCEVIEMACVHKILLDPSQFTCPGARYAFGCGTDLKEKMIQKLVDQKGYSSAYAEKLIEETPHCHIKPGAIGINMRNEPSVLVARLQPEQVMRLIQVYQRKLEKSFQTEISSVISACGNVTVKAVQIQDMVISFGCDDSREFGSLSRHSLFAGLPYSLAEKLIQ